MSLVGSCVPGDRVAAAMTKKVKFHLGQSSIFDTVSELVQVPSARYKRSER